MVAVIKTGTSILRTLRYNENKVQKGLAQCIGAGNYPVDLERITYEMKLKRFTLRTSLNENARSCILHISLNFAPSENYGPEKLLAVARSYINKIGFGRQPYLVYQHHDAGHPHLHLITLNIKRDGSRIYIHNLAARKSEPARREVEMIFGLAKAGKIPKNTEDHSLRDAPAKVLYGKTESKKALSGVLAYILQTYSFTSLRSLNAVLAHYNIAADRGNKNSKTFLRKGLLYKILNEQGKPAGIPFKASSLPGKPTLAFLKNLFRANALQGAVLRSQSRKKVNTALSRCASFRDLILRLGRENISAVLEKNMQGDVLRISYTDYAAKTVFIESTLKNKYIKLRRGENASLKNLKTIKKAKTASGL